MLLGTLYKWNHSICPFVSGLFHSTYCVLEVHPCSSMCQSFPSFLSLNNTPLHVHTHTHTHTCTHTHTHTHTHMHTHAHTHTHTHTLPFVYIHSSLGGHLNCFHLLAIVNYAAVNLNIQIPAHILLFSPNNS